MDEQVKQFYDIMMLSKFCLYDLDCAVVREKYIKRAEEEWRDRWTDAYDMERIAEDVRKQLLRYEMADSGEDAGLKKSINDFNSLYLNSKVDYSPQNVACGAALIKLMYELILKNDGWDLVDRALKIEEKLLFKQYSGKERGQRIRNIRELMVKEFMSYSAIPSQILKGKNLRRVFWAIADVDNLNDIENVVNMML